MKKKVFLPMSRDISKLTEYYDPESRLDYRVIERQGIEEGSIIVLEILMGETIVGYDVCICRNNKLPKSEDWGEKAWNWKTKEKAIQQFGGLIGQTERIAA